MSGLKTNLKSTFTEKQTKITYVTLFDYIIKSYKQIKKAIQFFATKSNERTCLDPNFCPSNFF